MYQNILEEALELKGQLTEWRRALHQMPEVGLELPKTSAFVQKALADMGIPSQVSVNGSCVTALLGSGPRCFLLRSDMDALPMEEVSGLPFASENGCMHACGHDMHAATLLGAALLLKRHESELKGQVKLLFQPGEETFNGAKAAVEEGVLENPTVDAAFAMHVFAQVPMNTIAYGEHPLASVFGFKITLTGVGGHGSMPEACIDPINTGVHIYLALQELIARECPPEKEAALTIGQFSAGSASNIIPQQAVLQGTLRTFDPEVRDYLIGRIRQVSQGVADTYRTGMDFEVLCNVPSVVCNPALNEELIGCLKEMDPKLNTLPVFHVMGSEDFAFISEKVPSSYFTVGAAVEEESERYGQHNPKVRFNEDALPTAAAAYTCAALEWLARHGEN